jgi:7-carboxy-7-deazaguanine synthase
MFISEIFHSIQGEGELTGVPSIFVRTSGCNLRCTWCDTKYASWKPEGDEISVEAVVEKVRAFPAQHCVLTGGEPMVAKEIATLAAKLRGIGKHITIETAGTIAPDGIACDLASLSPKLANSTQAAGSISEDWRKRHDSTRLQPEVLREWIDGYPYQLKFVLESADDLSEMEELLERIGRPIPPSKVLVMPQGVDVRTIRARDETLIELCLRRGYRYCNRLHIEIFGNKRGT